MNTGYLPLISTVVAFALAFEMFRYYLRFRTGFLLWWTLGLLLFGTGTLLESLNAFYAWAPRGFKLWYMVGALLGGFPLAQGTVTLLMPERFTRHSSVAGSLFALFLIVCVYLSPIQLPEDFDGSYSGELLSWQWIRWLTPVLNLYAFAFAFGGAVYSANQYFFQINKESRFISCIYVSFGTILPAIGGYYARIGYITALHITEMVAIILIYVGFRIFTRKDKSEAEVDELV